MPRKKHKIILVLGGARSGKSTYAQQLAEASVGNVLFCATAEPLDADMKKRIRLHRKARPKSWRTLEAACDLPAALAQVVQDYDTVIIDCITVLVANLAGKRGAAARLEKDIFNEIASLIALMQQRGSSYILVSNEVGLGVVPHYRMGREYRDTLGKVNQQLAAAADEVYFLIAGIPVRIK